LLSFPKKLALTVKSTAVVNDLLIEVLVPIVLPLP
jgi:hypothetical protein